MLQLAVILHCILVQEEKGGGVNFGALISKIDVIRANTGAFSLILMHKASFWGIYREDVSCLS